MVELTEQIKVVAGLRVASVTLNDSLSESRSLWELGNKNLIESVTNGKDAVMEAEAKLRELTLQAYAETGNKAPVPGVGIREIIKLEYDPKEALAWGLEHKVCLKLDVSAFEKMSKTASELRPSFVTLKTEPQATIATDLEAVLNKESE